MLYVSRKVDLLGYLPLFVQNYKEIQHIMEVEKEDLEKLFLEADVVRENIFIVTATEIGIKRYEKLLNIVPFKNDSLETRRSRILALWIRNVPYTYETLENMLNSLCGKEGYEMELLHNIYQLNVMLGLPIKDRYDDVLKLLNEVVPCNIGLNLYIDYNKHRLFKYFIHRELGTFTHRELREKVIIVDEYLNKHNLYKNKTYKEMAKFTHHELRRKGDWYGE